METCLKKFLIAYKKNYLENVLYFVSFSISIYEHRPGQQLSAPRTF